MIRWAAIAVAIIIVIPVDLPIQCRDSNYRRINPQVCGEQIYPFPDFGGRGNEPAGGGGGGGILGRILRGLTGGLL